MEFLSISAPNLDIQDSFGQEEMNDLLEWLADFEEDNIVNGVDEASTDSLDLRYPPFYSLLHCASRLTALLMS
eukprot:gene1815-1982_t